jgi:hypothetical protein
MRTKENYHSKKNPIYQPIAKRNFRMSRFDTEIEREDIGGDGFRAQVGGIPSSIQAERLTAADTRPERHRIIL